MRGVVAGCCGVALVATYSALFYWFRTTHTSWFHGLPATIINGQLTSDAIWKPFIPMMVIDARMTGRGAAVVTVNGLVWYANGTGEPLGP